MIYVTDQNGDFRSVRTNQLGYFRIDGVEVGHTIIVKIYHKRFQFKMRIVTINEQLSDLVLTPQNKMTKRQKR